MKVVICLTMLYGDTFLSTRKIYNNFYSRISKVGKSGRISNTGETGVTGNTSTSKTGLYYSAHVRARKSNCYANYCHLGGVKAAYYGSKNNP